MARTPKQEEAWRILVDLYLTHVADTLPSIGADPRTLAAALLISAPRVAKTAFALLDELGHGGASLEHERRFLLYERLKPRWLDLVQRWAMDDEITVDEFGDFLLTLHAVEGETQWGVTHEERARRLLEDPTLLPFLLEDLPSMMHHYIRDRTTIDSREAVFAGYGSGPDDTTAITMRLSHLLDLLTRHQGAPAAIMRTRYRELEWRWLQLFVSWWKYEEVHREDDRPNPAFLYLDDDPRQRRLFGVSQRVLAERTFNFEWPVVFYESDLEALDSRRRKAWKGYRSVINRRVQDPPEEGADDGDYPEEEIEDYADNTDQTLEEAAAHLDREGINQWSSSPFPDPTDWLEQADGSVDYETGQEVRLDGMIRRVGGDLSDIELCFIDCVLRGKFFW